MSKKFIKIKCGNFFVICINKISHEIMTINLAKNKKNFDDIGYSNVY